jgi:LPPG:FO 2-phospho-L-lactate transferase
MMQELGLEVSAVTVAERYSDLLSGYVIDIADVASAGAFALPVKAAPTLMTDLASREALATAVLAFADAL